MRNHSVFLLIHNVHWDFWNVVEMDMKSYSYWWKCVLQAPGSRLLKGISDLSATDSAHHVPEAMLIDSVSICNLLWTSEQYLTVDWGHARLPEGWSASQALQVLNEIRELIVGHCCHPWLHHPRWLCLLWIRSAVRLPWPKKLLLSKTANILFQSSPGSPC